MARNAPVVATYSIAACDLEAGQWGVATQSKFLAVGSVVPWAEPRVGAIATQAYANPRYGPDGLGLLRSGSGAEEVVARLTAADPEREHRQLGVVDATGGSVTFTGSECMDWAGGVAGPCFAAQGNILVGAETVSVLASTFTATAGRPLAERLLECVAAAQAAGGDRRGQQSAALLVVERDGGYAQLSDVLVDLRVDDHEQPVAELARLYDMHSLLFGKTPSEQWIEVDEELRAELVRRLHALGYEGGLERALGDWSGTENLEERVDGVERIDPVVLGELRAAGARSTEPPKSPGAGAETGEVSGYEILGLDDLDRLRSTDGTLVLRPLRRRLGFRPFGLNAWEAEHVGDQLIEPHREPTGTEELYVVVRGTARFTLGEETFDAPTGTLVHALPGTFRSATAAEPETIALACGAEAGKAFTPSGWEDFYVAFALLRHGEIDRARATMQEALGREPDAWQGQYNAACFEALAGETDAAFDHLQRAIAMNREVVGYAGDDGDLASLRDDPRYTELVR